MSLAYLLWFFLGTFGAHRFYLKRTGSGWVQFSVHVGGWLLIALALWRVGQGSYVETAQSGAYMMRMSWSAALGGGILAWMGWALLAIGWPWWLIDAFLIPAIALRFTRHLREAIGRCIRGARRAARSSASAHGGKTGTEALRARK